MRKKLGKAISASDTEIMVRDSDHSFPHSGTIQIDSEQIAFLSSYDDTLYGCIRGINGTTPASHAAKTRVFLESYYYPVPTGSGGGSAVEDYEEVTSDENSGILIGDNNAWNDMLALPLTAGDWDVSAMFTWVYDTGDSISADFCISTVSAGDRSGLNAAPAMNNGDTSFSVLPNLTGSCLTSSSISPKRFHLTSPTTLYAKVTIGGSNTPSMLAYGRLSATYVH